MIHCATVTMLSWVSFRADSLALTASSEYAIVAFLALGIDVVQMQCELLLSPLQISLQCRTPVSRLLVVRLLNLAKDMATLELGSIVDIMGERRISKGTRITHRA